MSEVLKTENRGGVGVADAIAEILRRNAPAAQLERFKVERWKQVNHRRGQPEKWAWVEVGTFMAANGEDARWQARKAMAERLCILRANPIGLAPAPRVEAGAL